MTLNDDPVRRLLLRLREDAYQRGMIEAAEVYGWSAIRRGNELLQALTQELLRRGKRP